MIEGKDPVLQAFLGTLMTWGLTALGAAMAFFIKGNQVTNELEWRRHLVSNYYYLAVYHIFTFNL